MKTAALTLLFLVVVPLSALAQPPAPKPADPPSIDQLYARIKELKKQEEDLAKQQADIAKQKQAVAAELKARLKELATALADLGIFDPTVPPKPPEPPAPVDPLKAKLAAAFAGAGGTADQKKEWAKDLAALYRAAAKLSNDPAVTTAATLKAKLSAAAGALIGSDALTEVRKAVAVELAAILPAEADLTADQRTVATALFSKLAGILDGLGN